MALWIGTAARVHGGPAGRRGHEGAGAWRCAHRSNASSHSGARELTGEGGKERGEHRGPFAGLTEARVVVW
jgi:hypothetical protein